MDLDASTEPGAMPAPIGFVTLDSSEPPREPLALAAPASAPPNGGGEPTDETLLELLRGFARLKRDVADDITRRLAPLAAELGSLAHIAQAARQEARELHDRLPAIDARLDAAVGAAQDVRARTEDVAQRLAGQTGALADLTAVLDQRTARLAELETATSTLAADLATLRTDLAALRAEAAALRAAGAALGRRQRVALLLLVALAGVGAWIGWPAILAKVAVVLPR